MEISYKEIPIFKNYFQKKKKRRVARRKRGQGRGTRRMNPLAPAVAMSWCGGRAMAMAGPKKKKKGGQPDEREGRGGVLGEWTHPHLLQRTGAAGG